MPLWQPGCWHMRLCASVWQNSIWKESEHMIRRSGNKTGTAAVLAAIVIGANGLLGTFPAGAAQTAVIEDGRVPLYSKPAGSYVRTPIASGVTVYKNDKATLDASNISEGYVMVKYTGSVGKIKVQITKSGSETYTYDLNNSGVYEVFPLSEGNGSYQVKVFENIQGNQYSLPEPQTSWEWFPPFTIMW